MFVWILGGVERKYIPLTILQKIQAAIFMNSVVLSVRVWRIGEWNDVELSGGLNGSCGVG